MLAAVHSVSGQLSTGKTVSGALQSRTARVSGSLHIGGAATIIAIDDGVGNITIIGSTNAIDDGNGNISL